MSDRKIQVLLEDVNHKFDTIAEALSDVSPMKESIVELNKKVDKLREDMSLVKLTLAIHGKKIDALSEMMTQNTVDIGTIKTKITKIEEELKSIKNLVKDKADKEKVQKLEESILILKRKIV